MCLYHIFINYIYNMNYTVTFLLVSQHRHLVGLCILKHKTPSVSMQMTMCSNYILRASTQRIKNIVANYLPVTDGGRTCNSKIFQ